MSGKKNTQQNTEQKEQKVVTKYDLKMQRRKEEKEREERQRRTGHVIGVVFVAALICLIASFPIRTYLALNETYVKINGESITRVEFDYHYNMAKTNYYNQFGYYLSSFGYDFNADPAKTMYSETMTLKDYYESTAVENIKKNKALLAEAKAEGFSCDTSQKYAEFESALKADAVANDTSVKEYVQKQYGAYATQSRIKKYVEETIFLNLYYEHLTEVKNPSDAEIESYYAENQDNYDSVDYRLSVIVAELPTEPTELADTVSGSDAAETYEPSQAEIDKAMADAKVLADAEEKNIAAAGTRKQSVRMSRADSAIRAWLFEKSRKAGDTTVIEDAQNHSYYVVAFEARYRNETLPVDVRALITNTMEGQEILDEWNAGEATEESFAELCKKYSTFNAGENGGLYENLLGTDMDEELVVWMFDESRKHGDVTIIKDENDDTYVIYYVGVGDGDPEWKADARSALLTQIMSDYLTGITEKVTVEDPKGHLNYLKEQETRQSAEDTQGSEGAQESSQQSTDAAQ